MDGNLQLLPLYIKIKVQLTTFEKIISMQMTSHFETSFTNFDHKLLFDGQHGFRANHSCETALHELLSACFKNMDKKLMTMLLFIDFKKAFDMVDHHLLLKKLMAYGFGNTALKLLQNYFEDRSQFTKIGSSSDDSPPRIAAGFNNRTIAFSNLHQRPPLVY